MAPEKIALAASLFCLGAATFALLERHLVRWWRQRAGRRRLRLANEGERRAEAILGRRGWRVVDRQVRGELPLEVDGEVRPVRLRADLLVERRGRLMIAEVKTGRRAPSLDNDATRRQLIEYRLAWPEVEGVLLVDATKKSIEEVHIPLPKPRGRGLAAFLLGVVTGVLVVLAMQHL